MICINIGTLKSSILNMTLDWQLVMFVAMFGKSDGNVGHTVLETKHAAVLNGVSARSGSGSCDVTLQLLLLMVGR